MRIRPQRLWPDPTQRIEREDDLNEDYLRRAQPERMTALFLSRFASKRMAKLLRPAVQLLAGIPSVVYGFFGLVVLVREVFGGTGSSLLTASVLLGMMILPTIITVAESALNAVPASY